MSHSPSLRRYAGMSYRRCGRRGLSLPATSLGLRQNFGGGDVFEDSRSILLRAFDHGVTHFNLANNYSPPYASAERNFERWMASDLAPVRDELLISTKAGYDSWPSPHGGTKDGRRRLVCRIRGLAKIAGRRGRSLVQMLIVWTIRDDRVASALVGARIVVQLDDTPAALDTPVFSQDELAAIDAPTRTDRPLAP